MFSFEKKQKKKGNMAIVGAEMGFRRSSCPISVTLVLQYVISALQPLQQKQ